MANNVFGNPLGGIAPVRHKFTEGFGLIRVNKAYWRNSGGIARLNLGKRVGHLVGVSTTFWPKEQEANFLIPQIRPLKDYPRELKFQTKLLGPQVWSSKKLGRRLIVLKEFHTGGCARGGTRKASLETLIPSKGRHIL